MAIELAKLIKKVEHMDITLVAGKGGMENVVTWVHMAETMEAADFLEGGQLAITTGIGLSSNDDILELLKVFYERKVSGVIINIGPFIEKIPEDAIKFCNEKEFPIFAVPWRAHLAEIVHIFCFAITKEEQKMSEVSSAFKNAIFYPKQEELYVVPLSQRSFRSKWNYSVTLIKLASDSKRIEERLESLCWSLEKLISRNNKNFAVFVNETELILVFANISKERLIEEIKDIQTNLKRLLNKGEKLSMGVGRLTKSVRCIYKSYNQAKSIQRLQMRGKIGDDKIFYSNMGIYRLLMGIEDSEVMKEYYNHTLKALEDYDEANNSDLCDTLRCYLNHDGSVKDTADELFVHRNTINYKLNKSEELLGIEMSSLAARTELMMAFNISDIM